jgi:hypothetical protein
MEQSSKSSKCQGLDKSVVKTEAVSVGGRVAVREAAFGNWHLADSVRTWMCKVWRADSCQLLAISEMEQISKSSKRQGLDKSVVKTEAVSVGGRVAVST